MKQEIARESSPERTRFQVSRLSFSEIPHQSRLFIEFQRDPTALKQYYPNAVESLSQIATYVPAVLANYRTDRAKLTNALIEINTNIGAGPETFKNIDTLLDPQSVAVVTGQQGGLFTGPLYTIYKALSAIKLAEDLNRNGTKAVPVFWTATEDHDFEEVATTYIIDDAGDLREMQYSPVGRIENSLVGNVQIDDEIEEIINGLFADLPSTEFSAEIRNLLSSSWSSGSRYGEAFMRTLASLLAKFGMVFIDPMSAGIRQLSVPIYRSAISNVDKLASSVVLRSGEIEGDGYHAQVLVEDDYFPLFWHDDSGQRLALRKSGEGKYRAGGNREFSLDQLHEIASTDPQRFSSGVMLRPVVQDYLLPTVCYFGGGAEIAYFAQNSEVYRVLGRPVTPIFHRQSFTIVEAKHARVLKKFDLSLEQMFDGIEKTLVALGEDKISPQTARMFADIEEKINTEMNRLDQAVSEIDITLAANIATRRSKIIYHIAALRKKTLLAQVRKDEIANRQIDRLFTNLLPNGKLQERSLNVVTFLNKFGLNFIDWIYDSIDLNDKDHRVVEL